MEKYYRVSDVNEILNKLAKEPAYCHDGEDFYNGVCAVEGELMCLEPIELREPKEGKWELKEVEAFWIQNMEESLKTGKPTKSMLPVCSCCKTELGKIVLDFTYCPKCGAKMIRRIKMNVELTIQDMFDRYPGLFKERADCLDHLFICIGNGFEWKKGELVDYDYSYSSEYQKLLKSHLVDGKAFQHNKLSLRGEAIYYEKLRKAEGRKNLFEGIYSPKEIEEMHQKHLASLPDDVYYKYPRVERWYDSHLDEEGKPYIRLCKNYAKLFNYPEDIKPDWLAAIEETKQLLIEDFGPDVFKE